MLVLLLVLGSTISPLRYFMIDDADADADDAYADDADDGELCDHDLTK